MSLATGRDIALVVLIIEAIVLSLVPLVLFYYGIRGMNSLRAWLDPKIPLAQEQLARIARSARTVSDYVVSPVMGVSRRSLQAQGTLGALLRSLYSAAPPEAQEEDDAPTAERGAA